MAMSLLGSGLSDAGLNLDALSVGEAELSTLLRVGASEDAILGVQNNLANTYEKLGRLESLRMRRDVYLGYVKLLGEDDERTLISANNYAASLIEAERFEEAKSLLLKAIPATQRSLGESDDLTLKMRWYYAEALCRDDGTTLDDIREAETTLEDTARIARRVLGGAHPLTAGVEFCLRASQAVLDARETPPPGACKKVHNPNWSTEFTSLSLGIYRFTQKGPGGRVSSPHVRLEERRVPRDAPKVQAGEVDGFVRPGVDELRHGPPDARRVLEPVAAKARRDHEVRGVRVPPDECVLVQRAELVQPRPRALDP
jgi:hypothetical protein